MTAADSIDLIDHHCHGVMAEDLTGQDFRLLATEADRLSDTGTETLDSQFGLALGALCAPALDLPRFASIEEYLTRRAQLGSREVNRRLMAGTNSSTLLVDSGFTVSPVLTPAHMQAEFGIPTHEVVRLERVAEEVAATTTAADFAPSLRQALTGAAEAAIGFKSVIVYRHGFDIPDHPPTARELRAAVDDWYATAQRTGSFRLTNPIVLRHLLWTAVSFGKPIQMHTGYGDSDIQLFRADPSRATRFFQATEDSGARFMLLHCYPFVREAAILTQVFSHVYADVGVTGHYLGPSAITTIRHILEIAPFSKILYSSDAYGLSEHYYVSATTWRRSIGRILDEWIRDEWIDSDRADRIVQQIAQGNARRVYQLKDDVS